MATPRPGRFLECDRRPETTGPLPLLHASRRASWPAAGDCSHHKSGLFPRRHERVVNPDGVLLCRPGRLDLPASDKSSASAASVSSGPAVRPASTSAMSDMFQQSVELGDVRRAQYSLLIDRHQGNVVEAQDRIAAVDQKPTPAIRTGRRKTPCSHSTHSRVAVQRVAGTAFGRPGYIVRAAGPSSTSSSLDRVMGRILR